MTKKIAVHFGFKKIFLLVTVIAVSLVLASLSRFMAAYSHDRDRFSFYVNNNDKDGAAKELINLKNDYLKLSGWHLQYFTDKYLLKDMYLYEAKTMILNEDYEGALDRLRGHETDHRALYLIGVAKFRVLHAAYHSDAAAKNQKIKDDILSKVLEDVSPDFEATVKKGPGSEKAFNYSYNYDLTSDKESAKKSLEGMPGKPQFKLGIPDNGDGPAGNKPGKKEKTDKRVDDPTAGKNDTRKKG